MNAEKQSQGTLYILVGPGGVGKNALMNAVLAEHPTLLQLPTATTRAPRDGEVDGVHHHFVSLAAFKHMIANDELLEHQEVHPGKFYGVPRGTVQEAVESGQNLIADIEQKGATIIRREFPQHTQAIFIAPPSVEALSQRLQDRQASQQDITDRLNRMASEMPYALECDIVLVNDDFDTAVAELGKIVEGNGEDVALEHSVAFTLSVKFVTDNQRLISPIGTATTLRINPGETPQAKINAFAQATFGVTPTEITYERGNGGDAVRLDFDPTTKSLHVDYYYVVTFAQVFDPPEGWRWEQPEMERES